jgi:hypothetical protein
MDRTILKLVPWDVWAGLAVAAMVLILACVRSVATLRFRTGWVNSLGLHRDPEWASLPRLTLLQACELRFALDQCATLHRAQIQGGCGARKLSPRPWLLGLGSGTPDPFLERFRRYAAGRNSS